jgi:hypothetical protein
MVDGVWLSLRDPIPRLKLRLIVAGSITPSLSTFFITLSAKHLEQRAAAATFREATSLSAIGFLELFVDYRLLYR